MSNEDNIPDNQDNQEYNTANPDHVNKKKTNAGRKDLRIKAAYAALLARPEGRELLREILEWCHVGHIPFDVETNKSYFMMGEMNIGLRIQASMVKADPKKYVEFLTEKV